MLLVHCSLELYAHSKHNFLFSESAVVKNKKDKMLGSYTQEGLSCDTRNYTTSDSNVNV